MVAEDVPALVPRDVMAVVLQVATAVVVICVLMVAAAVVVVLVMPVVMAVVVIIAQELVKGHAMKHVPDKHIVDLKILTELRLPHPAAVLFLC